MRTMEESIEQKAQERADRKLQYIIGRYGDANGERRKPYYREQLIQEAKAALSWEIFSLAFMELCKELGHSNHVKRSNSKCVSMLIDEEGLLKDNEVNLIGSYLYGVDQHGQRIVGNVLFVTDVYEGDGISFTGIEPETFEKLHEQLKNMAVDMKATVQSMKGAKA